MTDSTMLLWNKVCKTNPKDTKGFKGKGGFKGTAICAQSQRRNATEQWGPYGSTWGVRDENFLVLQLSDDRMDAVLVYHAELYYPEGSFPITADIDVWNYNRTDKAHRKGNDLHKKVATDALTKGLSFLGYNSDVHEGLFDDNKYVTERVEEEQAENAPKATPEQLAKIADGIKAVGFTMDQEMQYIEHLRVRAWADLPTDRADHVIENLAHRYAKDQADDHVDERTD